MPRRPRYLSECAPAKINLTLHVTGRTADHYHALHSLMVFADMGDMVRGRASHDMAFSIIGPFAAQVPGDDNLVSRSANALAQTVNRRDAAHLVLEKYLPVASGMGGGSADAAATLRLLSRLWGGNISDETLHTLAAGLGSDVPACLHGTPVYACGRGEILTDAENIPTLHAVLVNPGMPLATKDVFAHYAQSQPNYSAPHFYTQGDFTTWLRDGRNDLETSAIALCPTIAKVMAALREQKGCMLARLSGSGATCFGLFETAAQAQNAAEILTDTTPAWWVRAATLHGSDAGLQHLPETQRRYG